jgi:hypothetical protein
MTRRRVPTEKIEEAIAYWLLGDSARISAKKAHISKNVLLENLRKRPDAEIPIKEFHVIARRLRKEGLDIHDYFEIIRTKNYLLEMGLSEKYILPFMTEFAQFAYDFHSNPNKMAMTIIRFIQFMEEGGFKTPMQLAEYLKKQENNLERIREHAAECKTQAQEAFERGIRLKLNQKALETDPAIGFKIEELESEIKESKNKIAEKTRELEEFNRQAELPNSFIAHDIVQGEAKRLGRKLGRIVRPNEIYEKAQEIVRYPSRYSYLFLKCDLPPSLDPDSNADSQADGEDTNEIDSSDNSAPHDISSDRTSGNKPDTDTGRKENKFREFED